MSIKIACLLGLVVRALGFGKSDFLSRSQVLGRGMLVFFTIFSISGLIVMKLLWAIEDDVRILKSYR